MSEAQWLSRILLLESIAGVPGMVAATVRHLRSLRLMKRDGGWIHTLLEEAENERVRPFWIPGVLLVVANSFGFADAPPHVHEDSITNACFPPRRPCCPRVSIPPLHLSRAFLMRRITASSTTSSS